jgi:uncharacterized membrane protein (UPF0136 family)
MDDSASVLVSQNVLIHAPMAVALVIGAHFAWSRRGRHPQVSLLVGISLGLLFFAALEEAMRPSVVSRLAPADVDELVRVMKLRGLVNRAIVATAVGLLVWAAFGWRNAGARKPARAQET